MLYDKMCFAIRFNIFAEASSWPPGAPQLPKNRQNTILGCISFAPATYAICGVALRQKHWTNWSVATKRMRTTPQISESIELAMSPMPSDKPLCIPHSPLCIVAPRILVRSATHIAHVCFVLDKGRHLHMFRNESQKIVYPCRRHITTYRAVRS
jgi:hypothetical protein